MKLCVFPNDPLKSYLEKGEIKERYFNPNNLFDEVHVISPIEKDVNEEQVKSLVGNAKLSIHPIGRLNLLNFKSKLKKVSHIVKEINPDIIRSYNPLMQGWLATKIAKELSLPIIISIHNNYDKDVRDFYKKNKKILQYLKFVYSEKIIEKYCISNATKIICAYRFLVPYADRLGGKDISVVYNRVNLSKFSPHIKPKLQFTKKTLIYVARLDPEKNQECLIRAIKNLDVKLILIGKGNEFQKLNKLAEKLGTKDRIIFVQSVPNKQLGEYYNSADIFGAPIKQGGISIPMLEAMACGLPLIISSRVGNYHEDIDDAIIFSRNTPEDFKKTIETLIQDSKLMSELSKKSLETVKLLGEDIMEIKEEKIYRGLLNK